MEPDARHSYGHTPTLLAFAHIGSHSRELGACETSLFLGKDAAPPAPRKDLYLAMPYVLDWIISVSIAASAAGMKRLPQLTSVIAAGRISPPVTNSHTVCS